ncbi:MAG: hypothetical protein KGO05_01210 [Chloroflexota bacterium]|nr:hypothetical protein [Chloroflexota bacterium]
MQAQAQRDRRIHRGLIGAALALGMGAALVACGSPSTASQATPTATAASVASATPTAGGPTATPLPGSGNLAGVTDICTSKPNLTQTLRPELPAYNANLRLATQTTGGAYEYGYCVSADVDTILKFYTAQLPGKGWTSIQTFINNATRNLIATRGAEQLTITISPDVVQAGNADLLIIVSGG